MAPVAKGADARAVWRERFASWPLEAAAPQVVMNALDPLLLWGVLGASEAARWLPPILGHYTAPREGAAATLLRSRPHVGAAARVVASVRRSGGGGLAALAAFAAASSSGGGAPPAPAESGFDRRRAPGQAPAPASRGGGFSDPPAAPAAARPVSRAAAGAPVLPYEAPPAPPRPARGAEAAPAPRPVRRAAPSAAPGSVAPVRHRPGCGLLLPLVHPRTGGYASPVPATNPAPPLSAAGRAGRASLGRRARELFDAIGSPPVPYRQVRPVSDDLAAEGWLSGHYAGLAHARAGVCLDRASGSDSQPPERPHKSAYQFSSLDAASVGALLPPSVPLDFSNASEARAVVFATRSRSVRAAVPSFDAVAF